MKLIHWLASNNTVIGNIADKRFHLLRSMSPFRGLPVYLSVTFVHCAQTAEDTDKISFAYDSPMYFPDRVKIWLTSVDPFLHKYRPKVTNPC